MKPQRLHSIQPIQVLDSETNSAERKKKKRFPKEKEGQTGWKKAFNEDQTTLE